MSLPPQNLARVISKGAGRNEIAEQPLKLLARLISETSYAGA